MSRVKKFKDYRNSLQNNSEDVLSTHISQENKDQKETIIDDNKPNTESLSTLSVSYDKIMEAANEVEELENINKDIQHSALKKKILKISLIVFACLLVTGIIIAAGILVFKK